MTDQIKNIMVVTLQLGTHFIKMETNQKISYGLIGILYVVVAAFGGSLYFTENELNNLYVCTTNQNVGYFEYLSSTAKTGYWLEDNVTKSLTCRNGFWINIKVYSLENNISISDLLEPKEIPIENNETEIVPSGGYGIRYSCSSTKCVRIE
jgi:hypothetical protein